MLSSNKNEPINGIDNEGNEKYEVVAATTNVESDKNIEPTTESNSNANEAEKVVEVTEPETSKLPVLNDDHGSEPNFWQRQSIAMSRRPWTFFWLALVSSLGLGIMGMIVGGFEVSVDGEGFVTRGTLIADRHTQMMLVDEHSYELLYDSTGTVWDDLINNVQSGWELEDDDDNRRRLYQAHPEPIAVNDPLTLDDWSDWGQRFHAGLQWPFASRRKDRQLDEMGRPKKPFVMTPSLVRRLQEAPEETGVLEGCDTQWYTSDSLFSDGRLWPVWRLRSSTANTESFLNANLLEELCLQEQQTQKILIENNLCFGCQASDKCLQPYSLVLMARLTVADGLNMDCAELGAAWSQVQESVEQELGMCVEDLRLDYNPERDGTDMPESCPTGFYLPSVIDGYYETTNRVEFTSSIFATSDTDENLEAMYDRVDSFASGNGNFVGVYDTQNEDFINLALDDQLLTDMSLALGSAVVTTIAMMIHTRSPFLSLIGLLQILISFPLAYFWYTFVAQLDFFPFLNFIGVFVIFALGADDVFVAVDKWKNARIENPNGETSAIAAVALPEAAMAMLLTTLTTAVAFFGTAVCLVAPIRCFAVFVGLLVVFDYLLCILLVFPALCIYDQRRHVNNCCCRCFCCRGRKSNDDGPDARNEDNGEKENLSLIRRILYKYYDGLHFTRFPLLLACIVALVISSVYAASIELPTTSDVRLYDEEDNQFEKNFLWRQNLLFAELEAQGGSTAFVIWGVKPADTGDHNDPSTWSQLVLDNSFQPSDTDAQVYLRDFCDRFFANEFATLVESDYVCPMNQFDAWLSSQANSTSPHEIYEAHCNGAAGIPMAEEDFDKCIYEWGQLFDVPSVLARNGVIEIMYVKFISRVRYDSPFEDLDDEWHAIERWFKADNRDVAPDTAKRGYFSSEDFWWYDTNNHMLRTAFASAGIALAAAAGVILFSSRSFVLTAFATITVGYVLTSVTATLVGLGWTLGFLESILFAILIGVSCDFVVHFSHAYSAQPGDVPRAERTKHALISMGPSILAAGFTTFAAAMLMLFTIITFFEKFAVVLFLTILQALVGSFVVFLTLTDCCGPSCPTYLFDRLFQKNAERE